MRESKMCDAYKNRLGHSTIYTLFLLAFAIVVLVAASPAEASDFDGKIRSIKFSSGSSSARVSISVGEHRSPCKDNPEWFAFENASQGIGAVWTSALIAALANNRSVSIFGTEACDSSGTEGVLSIELR
jgi:hypothetical protein